jgi:hypothetical protein
MKSSKATNRSINHQDLTIITCKHHPDALKQIIVPIVKKYDLACDIYEEDLSHNEKRILESIEIER